MAISVTKSGPYFTSGAISFSAMRNTFRLNNPTGTISASEFYEIPILQTQIQFYLMQQRIVMLQLQLIGKLHRYEIVLSFII